jgi:hypothetical protein
VEVATLAKRERGVALNLSVKVATPLLFAREPVDESKKAWEPTFIGKLPRLVKL